ncbi:MAG: hypothetical protein NXI31_11465 [bacterium]|nr:hypothetical protein [bacterium]
MAARMKVTPTTQTLSYLRARGWLAEEAERQQGRIKRDLFGCIDIHAVHPSSGEFLYVQVTDHSHRAHRVTKTRTNENVPGLLAAGARVEVWTWAPEDTEPHVTRLVSSQNTTK